VLDRTLHPCPAVDLVVVWALGNACELDETFSSLYGFLRFDRGGPDAASWPVYADPPDPIAHACSLWGVITSWLVQVGYPLVALDEAEIRQAA
jgi:hypothetical protein